jgi:integrase
VSNSALADLSFLDIVFPRLDRVASDRYTSAHWLRTEFSSTVWVCQFGDRCVTLDWDVAVGTSGQRLTSPCQALLLRTFKCWLVLSTHPDVHRGALWSPKTEIYRFSRTLDWIDYFLVRADELNLSTSGLACLSRDEMTAALFTVAAACRKSESVYDFGARLSAYLRTLGRAISSTDLRELVEKFPFLACDVPHPDVRVTDLTEDEVVRARAALWQQGMYSSRSRTTDYEWHVPLSLLTPRLYAGILRRHGGRRLPVELNLVPDDRVNREYPGVPVRNESSVGIDKINFRQYVRSLRELGLLHNVGLPVPITSLRTLDAEFTVPMSSLRGLGRFKTVSPDIVFFALRGAIDFVLTKGDRIVDVFLATVMEASNHGSSPSAVLTGGLDDTVAAASLRDLGISRWTIRYTGAARERGRGLSRSEYHPQLRANVGLWDLLRVLYGAVQLIVGALMARRVSELVQLRCLSCIDDSRTYLLFHNAKSGVMGNRQLLARPIPPIAVRAIGLIQRLQQSLLDAGLIDSQHPLTAYPTSRGISFTRASGETFGDSLDYFFDYIEMPLDEHGRRYYLRQHQLRRFFAMTFFWSNSFGGMDTLREFLGHTDATHLYHYITESTPGEVLRGVKAEWAAEALRTQLSAADSLADLVEDHFGTRQFRLLDTEDLTDYIDGLLEAGGVQIEPEFLDSRGAYRIAIRVLSTEPTA